MTIRDIIAKVDRSKKNQSPADISYFCDEMNIYYYGYPNQERLMGYYIGSWHCTDSTVGYRVYFLDDEVVAVSSQTGRKSSEELEWISKEMYTKTFNYIMSIVKDESSMIPSEFCNLDEDMGEGYRINYHGQLYSSHLKKATLNGKPVKIVEKHTGQQHNELMQYEPSLVKVELEDGTISDWMEIKNILFDYYLKESNEG